MIGHRLTVQVAKVIIKCFDGIYPFPEIAAWGETAGGNVASQGLNAVGIPGEVDCSQAVPSILGIDGVLDQVDLSAWYGIDDPD